MNENKNSEEIEVLDGLDDFFELTPNETEKEEEKPQAEEVFSVLDEPEEEEENFSTFEPDKIVEEPTFENLEIVDLKPTIEPVVEPEVFSMEETVEPELSTSLQEEEFNYPSFESAALEPIELSSPEEENPTTDEMFQWDVEEPEVSETLESNLDAVESMSEVPTADMNYNFMEEFAPQETPTIDDAFQFEPTKVVEESLTLPEEPEDSDVLGKTVVIEPVEPKEMQEEKQQEEPNTQPEVSKELPEEEKPKQKKQKKEKKKKEGNGRTMLFVVLLGILLLAFVALIPIILETFAV